MTTSRPTARNTTTTKKARRSPLWRKVFLPVLIVVLLAPVAENASWSLHHSAGLTWLFEDLGYLIAAGLIIVITFHGIWIYKRDEQDTPESEAMRDAIAATVIVFYLVLLSWAVFFSSSAQSNPIGDQLLASFTATTSVVVAFYFTSVAAVSWKQASATPSKPEPEQKTSDSK
jgi:hypothetical protein